VHREGLARVARALTDRRVGVALSGGGAWTFAHLALLEAMRQEGIPIDMVSGASGGSLVGAYYCALGYEGLARLRKLGPRLTVASLIATAWSTRALGWGIDLDLEGRRLRDLDVPLFPIIADLTNSAEFVPRRGGLKVSECVRASSTLVPFMTTTRFEGRRVIDGLYVNNTGEHALAEEGAALIIASDVVQSTADAPPGGLLDLVYRLGRIRDSVDGGLLLTRTADGRDSFLAQRTFRPRGLPTSPALMSAAHLNETFARPQAERFVAEEVKPLWDRLRAP